MNVGERIKSLREKKNITVNKLANLAGISQSYLREIELGNKQPTVEYLEYICAALNISLKDFFKENTDSISPTLLTAIARLSSNEQEKLAEFLNSIIK